MNVLYILYVHSYTRKCLSICIRRRTLLFTRKSRQKRLGPFHLRLQGGCLIQRVRHNYRGKRKLVYVGWFVFVAVSRSHSFKYMYYVYGMHCMPLLCSPCSIPFHFGAAFVLMARTSLVLHYSTTICNGKAKMCTKVHMHVQVLECQVFRFSVDLTTDN